MARKKKAQKAQETTLVPHRTPDLSVLLEEALSGDPQAVRAYLDAGGSAVASAHLHLGDITLEKQLPLLHGMTFSSWHPHQELAESVKLLMISTLRSQRTASRH
jgi:hypothetical protein